MPTGRAHAHRSDRASRDRDRHHDRRVQRAAHHRKRTRAHASATPGITAELPAQAAHGPKRDRTCADVVRVMLTRAARLATRSPLCAKRSTGARGSAGQGSASPMGLPQSYPGGAPEGDSNSVPVSTAERSRHRTRHAETTPRETASRSAAAPTCQPHIIKLISRSTTQESPRSSPCALHSSRNAPATMGLALGSDERNLGGLPM